MQKYDCIFMDPMEQYDFNFNNFDIATDWQFTQNESTILEEQPSTHYDVEQEWPGPMVMAVPAIPDLTFLPDEYRIEGGVGQLKLMAPPIIDGDKIESLGCYKNPIHIQKTRWYITMDAVEPLQNRHDFIRHVERQVRSRRQFIYAIGGMDTVGNVHIYLHCARGMRCRTVHNKMICGYNCDVRVVRRRLDDNDMRQLKSTHCMIEIGDLKSPDRRSAQRSNKKIPFNGQTYQ
jgi:hypothetical protein